VKTKFNIFDALLAVVLAAAAFFLFFYGSARWSGGRSGGLFVRVLSGSDEIRSAPLDVDRIIKIRDGFTVKIEKSRVSVLSSDCPKKICEHSGSISRAGDSIVCAPNKIAVTIVAKDINYDAVTK
jgi:hypothetical protein